MKLTPKLFDYISDYKYEITSFDFKKIILGVCSAKTSFVSCLSLTHLLINFLSRSVYRARSPVSVIVLAWLLPNQQCI